MLPTQPLVGPKLSDEAAEIERFRARHRRLQRDQTLLSTPSSKVGPLDVDDGRTRKISAKSRQKQQQMQLKSQQDDGNWPVAAGTEMHVGFNAFDFSASPEAFQEDPELHVESKSEPLDEKSEQKQKERMAGVAKQVMSMGFNSAILWERRFPDQRQPGRFIRQLPTFGQSSVWSAPVHYATPNDQRRALYYQPQYYA
ncbi:hypothetical protein PRIC1_003473 [Phytophthora ramorum]